MGHGVSVCARSVHLLAPGTHFVLFSTYFGNSFRLSSGVMNSCVFGGNGAVTAVKYAIGAVRSG